VNTVDVFLASIVHRPVESYIGARETIIAGPCHNRIPYAPRSRRRRRRDGVEREETWEGMSPHRPTRRLGKRRKLPAPAGRKWILCIFEVRKKPSGTLFKYFWAMAGPPNVAGTEKTSFLPPLDGPDCPNSYKYLKLILKYSILFLQLASS